MLKITNLLKFTDAPRIVMLIGMPGVGKSTTAIQLAHQERDKGTAVMYVNLNGMGSVSEIKRKIVKKAFRPSELGEDPSTDFEVWASECSKPLLLILDNFDQLLHYDDQSCLDFSAFFDIGDNESYLTRTTVLITSREQVELFKSLDVQVYPLTQLSDTSSIDLLANHLKLVTPQEQQLPSREQLRPVAELIEGVPLALRIAADLIKENGIENVTSKLNESLTKHLWLKKSHKSIHSSKQNYSSSIRVSYDYLSDGNKTCGQYLSCFPASFTTPAAVAIVGSLTNQSEDSIRKCLVTLEHFSLLQPSNEADEMYDFHKLLKDYFNSELNSSEEQVKFESVFCHYYTERLQHLGDKYLTDSIASLEDISTDRHNLLYMVHLLGRLIETNSDSPVLNTTVHAIVDTMSLEDGSILAHLFSSRELHQSLTKIVEYVDGKTFEGSMSPKEFTRYGTVVYFWALRYSFAKGKLPENGALSARSLEKKVHNYLSSINAEDCSFPAVVIPCIRILEITCYDKHKHTALSLCSQGNETLDLLTDKLEQHDHTKCPDTPNALRELGLAHYALRNIEDATAFLEKMVQDQHLYSPETFNPVNDSLVFVTLCKAYGHSERADECDRLCESIVRDLTGVPVSGKNFRLFGLMFMYYWKHNMLEKSRNVTEELLQYLGNRFSPKDRTRGFRLDLRCLLTSIATYYHSIRNYSAAIETYQTVIKTSFAKSVYHRHRPLVATTNDLLSAFCQFRMGLSKIFDRQLHGLSDINDAIARTLTIARNETLHEHLNRNTHPEDAEIVTIGSWHLATIVCGGPLMFHPQCLWQVLQGTLFYDWNNTQYMYYHICGYDDPYGTSFDPWRLN